MNFKLIVVVKWKVRYKRNSLLLSDALERSSKKSTAKTTDFSHKSCPHWAWKWTPACSPNPWGLPCLAPAHRWVKIQFWKRTTPLGNNSESEVTQSCPTLCNPMDYSLPGSSVHGIFQARTLEWTAISFSRGSSQPRNRTQVSSTAGRFFTNWASPGRITM